MKMEYYKRYPWSWELLHFFMLSLLREGFILLASPKFRSILCSIHQASIKSLAKERERCSCFWWGELWITASNVTDKVHIHKSSVFSDVCSLVYTWYLDTWNWNYLSPPPKTDNSRISIIERKTVFYLAHWYTHITLENFL